MDKVIQEQVERAIKEKLYCFRSNSGPFNSPDWVRPIRIEGDNIIMLWGDCGIESRSDDLSTWSTSDWMDAVGENGDNLFRKVGMWEFNRASDPAIEAIAFCHKYPDSAGRKMYELEMHVERLLEENRQLRTNHEH